MPYTPKPSERQQRIDAYMANHSKSPITAFLLAFLFGPLGYLYTSLMGGFFLVLLTIGLALLIDPVVTVVPWLLGIVAAPIETYSVNKKRRSEADLMAGPK